MVRYGILILMLGIKALALAQGGISFEPVQASGLPYAIIIRNAEWNESECPDGTLIGAFSDSLCVGVAEYQTGGNVQLISWAGDPMQQLPGFTPGDTMQFYALIPYLGEWYVCSAEKHLIEGNGCFGWGAYSALDLNITDSSFLDSPLEIGIDNQLNAFPNPCPDRLFISSAKIKIQSIELFDFSGRLLQTLYTNDALFHSVDLQFYPDGLYFIRVYEKNNRQTAATRPVCLSIQKISAD